jgi:hypothetical protein
MLSLTVDNNDSRSAAPAVAYQQHRTAYERLTERYSSSVSRLIDYILQVVQHSISITVKVYNVYLMIAAQQPFHDA